MTEHSPITPPPELVQQWMTEARSQDYVCITEQVAACAAKWGADTELAACCELLKQKGVPAWSLLRSHRRPKPPSLKEQALMALEDGDTGLGTSLTPTEVSIIRRALEALLND